MRKAGVLLHISSLPGEFGCGTFGKWAYAFADFLAEGGFQIWQVLPFNLPHRDASPYSSVSTFVQNSLFIDPEILCNKNLLTPEEVERLREEVPQQGREYYDLAQHRERYLRLAAERAGKSELREKVSKDTGVPASLLTAETEEACKDQAEAIKANANPKGYPSFRDGGEVQPSGTSATRDKFADWFNETMK